MSEIDNHIKNTLSDYHPQFDPNDWANMEKLLDKKKKRRVLWFWFIGASLLLGAMGTANYYYLQQQSVITSAAAIPSSPAASNVGLKEDHISQKGKATKTSEYLSTTSLETIVNSTHKPSTTQFIATHPTSTTNAFSDIHETQSVKKEMATLTINTNNEITSSIQNQSTENERIDEVLKEVNVSLSKRTPQSMANKSLESIDSLPLLCYALAEEEALLSPDTAKRNQEKTKKTALRWYIEANGGINVPFVKHSSLAKIEPEANLLLGLQLKRLRCFAGLGYSNMNVGFDLKKDNLAIQTNDSSIILFVSASQHYINIPIGIGYSIYRNNKLDVFISATMINHLKVSNERKGIYKKVDNILLVPNDNSYAIADINPDGLTNAYPNNTKEKVNEVSQLLNSTILSSQKYYVSGKFGVGISYKISHFLTWNIEGSYTIAPRLSPFYGNKMGVTGNTGLRYYFK